MRDSIKIVEVVDKRGLDVFIKFNYRMYKNCQYAVPDLYVDLASSFIRKKNAALEFCDTRQIGRAHV